MRQLRPAPGLNQTAGAPVIRVVAASVCLVLSSAGCGSVQADSPPPEPKEHVRAYMLQALSFIEENSYDVATSLRPDWEQVEQSALERTSEAQTTQDTYPVIADVLRKATGDHSFLLTPDEIAATKSGERETPSSIMVGQDIAALSIPAFNETAGGLVADYVNSAMKNLLPRRPKSPADG